jgi:hypothetical protein
VCDCACYLFPHPTGFRNKVFIPNTLYICTKLLYICTKILASTRPIVFLILFLLVSRLEIAHQFSVCERVYEYFPYCLDFLVGFTSKPIKRCCTHIEKLNILAEHRTSPQAICYCIQYSVKGTQPPLIPSCIQSLPIMCHTHLSFPISDSMDCSK